MGRFSKLVTSAIWTMVGLLLCTTSFASNIVPIADHVNDISIIYGDDDGTSDLLTVRKPGATGISINVFDHFDINAPLKLINAPAQTAVASGQSVEEPAQLIVIVAPNIYLNDAISIAGPATDILFVTADSSVIQCGTCEINNAHRITLAAGAINIADPVVLFGVAGADRDQINKINAVSTYFFDILYTGSISIGSLNAPGALSLDILAPSVSVSQQININQRASRNADGGYVNDPNGWNEIGTGQINILAGGIHWDYENQKILGTDTRGTGIVSSISGRLDAQAVEVTTTHHLDMNGVIDTETDLLSTVRYNNDIKAVSEHVTLQAVGDQGSVYVNGQIITQGNLDIRSKDEVRLQENSSLTSPVINILARNNVINKGPVESDFFSLAGQSVLNRGDIQAFEHAQFYATQNIINEYGGMMRGKNVVLEAGGYLRNGGRCAPASDELFATSCDALPKVEVVPAVDPSQAPEIYTTSQLTDTGYKWGIHEET
ncbi:MAG: hypothetical protein MI867_14800, partial [Pseudomonadales bacterium]|nr:hypothetical protein [Pseudomonadales bacterium]